jgi:hypothetical protein
MKRERVIGRGELEQCQVKIKLAAANQWVTRSSNERQSTAGRRLRETFERRDPRTDEIHPIRCAD